MSVTMVLYRVSVRLRQLRNTAMSKSCNGVEATAFFLLLSISMMKVIRDLIVSLHCSRLMPYPAPSHLRLQLIEYFPTGTIQYVRK